MATDAESRAAAARLDLGQLRVDRAFVRFDQQDSGCVSFGLEVDGKRWFVKTATTPRATSSLENAIRVHELCRHPAIVSPIRSFGSPMTLVYPWVDGSVLNHATHDGSNRAALERFRELDVSVIEDAIDVVLDAHSEVARRGLVSVDFYDGCLLYDFEAQRMRLIDLDEYRLGPFVLTADRLPGSTSYMAPEEFVRGASIDERTTVFHLGRMIGHLMSAQGQWRGTQAQATVVDNATADDPELRFVSVGSLADAWAAADRSAQ